MIVRAFEPAVAERVCEIFYRSAHEVARAKYDRAQRAAWAPSIPDDATWLPALISFDTYLAIDAAGAAIA